MSPVAGYIFASEAPSLITYYVVDHQADFASVVE